MKNEKKSQLKFALRENLKKRKQQARKLSDNEKSDVSQKMKLRGRKLPKSDNQ